jgi:hypothetical protein
MVYLVNVTMFIYKGGSRECDEGDEVEYETKLARAKLIVR